MYLSNLGSGLRDRYIHTGESSDLEGAINAYQKAVNLMPEHNPGFPRLLSNLGISLHDRYSETGELSFHTWKMQLMLLTGLLNIHPRIHLTWHPV